MDRIKMCLDDLQNDVQTFNRNNQVLVDNWQDRKSEHFGDTCITVVNGNCQEFMQTVEQVRGSHPRIANRTGGTARSYD